MSKSTIITTFVVSSILTTCCFANTPSQTVKITPLGSHAGEFCRYDRAMLFEDPNGTRILYDPGHTVAGPNDPRLGKIDAVILSSVHTDHLGSSRIAAANAGTCKKPNINVKTPNSNTAEIIVNKNAVSHLGGEMAQFMQNKVKAAGGRKLTNIKKLRFGGEATVGGVKIAVVPVTHSNGAEPVFLDKKLKALLGKNGLTAYVGPDNGFILSFTNGLVVYLSGDSGITAEQDVTVRNYYGAKLAIINAGGVYTSGPKEAAYSINELVKPNAVIPEHMNEQATKNGRLLPNSKTAQFKKLVKNIPVYIPLSGRTMSFNAKGICVKSCVGS